MSCLHTAGSGFLFLQFRLSQHKHATIVKFIIYSYAKMFYSNCCLETVVPHWNQCSISNSHICKELFFFYKNPRLLWKWVGGSSSHSDFFLLENRPKIALNQYWYFGVVYHVYSLYTVYTILKVVGYYDLSVLSMSVMVTKKKKFGWFWDLSNFVGFFLTLQSPLLPNYFLQTIMKMASLSSQPRCVGIRRTVVMYALFVKKDNNV